MVTKIVFKEGEPREIILNKEASYDDRLVTTEGTPGAVRDEGEQRAVAYPTRQLGTIVYIANETRDGDSLNLPQVESITHSSE